MLVQLFVAVNRSVMPLFCGIIAHHSLPGVARHTLSRAFPNKVSNVRCCALVYCLPKAWFKRTSPSVNLIGFGLNHP
jgi:hypothetical protein